MPISKDELMQTVQSIEKRLASAKEIRAEVKDIYSMAKSAGYDPKYIKLIIKLREKDPDEIAEQDELTAMYRGALGI